MLTIKYQNLMHLPHAVYHLIMESVLIMLFFSNAALVSADNADSLFKTDEVVRMELRADFSEIQKDRIVTPEIHTGELKYNNPDGSPVKLSVLVSVRGNFRKNPVNCSFPPLFVDFRKSDVSNTLFQDQEKLKLVTPCQSDEDVIDEYVIYKLYNKVTDLSLKVRLVKILYFDTGTGEELFEKFSFFLEDKDHAAERNGLKEKDFFLTPFALDKENFMKLSVFQYLIGNKDWFVTSRHNIILMQPSDSTLPPYAVPYDFDFSGFVDAPYTNPAQGPENPLIDRRVFKGLCYTEAEFREVFDFYRELRPVFKSIIKDQKLISPASRRHILDYMSQFYGIINTRDLIKQEFLGHCETKKMYNIPE